MPVIRSRRGDVSGGARSSSQLPGLFPELPLHRPRVLRVLARIIADLDGLAGFPPITEEDVKKGSVEARRARHRRGLAEPDPSAKPLTAQQQFPVH